MKKKELDEMREYLKTHLTLNYEQSVKLINELEKHLTNDKEEIESVKVSLGDQWFDASKLKPKK